MIKPLGSEERAAWDVYAASAVHGYFSWQEGRPVYAEGAAEDAAKVADAMLAERRKRISSG